jgi:hypothetical protein
MVRAFRTVTLLVILTLLASACTFARISVNNPLRTEDVSFIVPGQTSFTNILARLGVPDSISPSEDGMVATYYFLDAKYSRVNFGLIARFWSPVEPDLIFAAGGLGLDMFQVQLDGKGVARASSFAYHTRDRQFNAWPFSRGAPSSAPAGPEPPDDRK